MVRVCLAVTVIILQLLIVPTTETGNVVRSNFFNIELFQAVNRESHSNVIISPLSVKVALMTMLEKTGGRTRQQLLATLRLPDNEDVIRDTARHVLIPLRSVHTSMEISFGTRVWVDKGTTISISYNNFLRRNYNGDLESVDFSNPKNSASAINEWVRHVTRNNTQSIVKAGSINPDTRLLLTSALSFRGNWLKPFAMMTPGMQCFHIPNGGCQNVPMMMSHYRYKYVEIPALEAEVVEIPYEDKKLSMLVVLPANQGMEHLRSLSNDLSYTRIADILDLMVARHILLIFPKFTIENKLDLQPALEAMGIEDLFDRRANFVGHLANITARVGSIRHSAKIEVDEVGPFPVEDKDTIEVPHMDQAYPIVRCTRPFLFAIIDRASRGIMFAGRIVHPGAPSGA